MTFGEVVFSTAKHRQDHYYRVNSLYCRAISVWLPSPIPEFSSTPQENHMADDNVRASSSSSSLFTLNLPNGLKGDWG